ncbi:MAG: hypothetical protein COA96_16095 [SAR86 cluster bacterium]|uniref:Cytochrome C n=1 Tax=SAR86 cluster bacterium TaxID=2030880 RepID=A0A2A5AKT5_9GAMM|nr:MAG: hypothetical protein COA96_16095 [SAR86 cluster bacterium]
MGRTVVFLVLVAFLAPLNAAEVNLKNIMRELETNLLIIIESLLVDDREQLVLAAKEIAQHPPIPVSQRMLIAEELGDEMAQFAQFDQVVHSLSLELEERGLLNSEPELIRRVQEILSACVSCHSVYKSRIASVLAGH